MCNQLNLWMNLKLFANYYRNIEGITLSNRLNDIGFESLHVQNISTQAGNAWHICCQTNNYCCRSFSFAVLLKRTLQNCFDLIGFHFSFKVVIHDT